MGRVSTPNLRVDKLSPTRKKILLTKRLRELDKLKLDLVKCLQFLKNFNRVILQREYLKIQLLK